MAPLGGAKGATLALMVELLAAGLTGANFAAEASSFLDAEGPPPGTGQLIIAIDAGGFGGGGSGLRCWLRPSRRRRVRGFRALAVLRCGEKAAREGLAIAQKLREEIEAL